jgi:polysaccharide export outer membrane protein
MVLLVFLFCIICSQLGAQERQELREQARQHYLQGKEFYSQGRYKEATEEFQKALEIAQSQEAPVVKEVPLETRIEETKIEEIEKKEEIPIQEVKKEEIPSIQVGEYYIEIGDVLDISVWKAADLSCPEVIVRPDGKISLPLIGDVPAVGLTLTQLDAEITQRYTLYVRDPQVSVMIKRFGGNKVIVLGDIARPGVYNFTGTIRLIEALALAGDCTKYAVRNNIIIIRGDIHKNPTVISANLLAFLKDAKIRENVLIQPQDVIFVPRSLIGNIRSFLDEISPIIDSVYKGKTYGE